MNLTITKRALLGGTLAGILATIGACHHQSNGGNDASVNTDQGAGTDFSMACATSSAKAELAPLDMLIILDTSASMDYEGKWTSVKLALKSFVTNSQAAGLGFGIQYYPLRAQCNRSDYAVPAVPIQVLPSGNAAIKASLEAQQMSGGTPIVPAFEGVFDYLKQWATANPTHKVVMVLASDGAPDDSCIAPTDMGLTNSLANATQIAMSAYTSNPQVSTFVIGVGSETSTLQQIATAGGGQAIFVDTSTDIQGAFLDALTSIRGNALSCQFPIPNVSDGGTSLDFDAVNVLYTPAPNAQPDSLVNVGDITKCASAPANGWYYDDPLNPTEVVLCQDACAKAVSGTTGRIDVVFGCKTIVL